MHTHTYLISHTSMLLTPSHSHMLTAAFNKTGGHVKTPEAPADLQGGKQETLGSLASEHRL